MTNMTSEDIEALLKAHAEIAHMTFEGDGRHYELTVVSDVFLDQPKVKRQLWVYTLLNPYILSGQVHALQMNTWTKSEWQKICGEK